jgi:hypothetical protein
VLRPICAYLGGILLGFDDDPTAIADLGQHFHEAAVVERAIPRDGEHSVEHAGKKTSIATLQAGKDVRPDIFAVNVGDSFRMRAHHCHRVDLRQRRMTGIEREPHRSARVFDESIQIRSLLHHRAQMMVIGET